MPVVGYPSKTEAFEHQANELLKHGGDAARGYFWEPGCGKTKPIIDETAAMYDGGEIDGLLVLAPNGVHRNWVSDEIPTHMNLAVEDRTRCHIWYSKNTKQHRDSFEATLKHKGLAVLVMSYHAILTERGKKAWQTFLRERKCAYVLDESHRVKNPGAKWSRRIIGTHTESVVRRVLSGTPVSNSPFDLFNQLKFLNPRIWDDLGVRTFAAFKQYFGVWETWQTGDGRQFPKCLAFRNLPLLQEKLLSVGSRITKDSVLDLPEKLYTKRYVELTPQQRRLYQQLKDDCAIELATGEVTANLAIVRLLRFQQVVCGYLPKSDDQVDELVSIEGGNPRLKLLAETLEDIPHQFIVWARFKQDLKLIKEHPSIGNKVVVVSGDVSGPERGEVLDRFKRGEVQGLVATPGSVGIGFTFTCAKTVIYYSNSFKLEERQQSEDRAHRIGQDSKVNYIDLVAEGTVDERIVNSLRMKVNVASQVTGDTLKDWI